MEQRAVNGVESEEISESFMCCVCLELLYKPIVLSCGHISCFWCVHKSMDSQHKSHCAICRNPYSHFPSVCQLLHLLLIKMYPVAYRERDEQISGEERKTGIFSPQIDIHGDELHTDCANSSNSSITEKEQEMRTRAEGKYKSMFRNWCDRVPEASGVKENNLFRDNLAKNYGGVSTFDLLCLACTELLFRPVVLNCGHAYCEACVVNPNAENKTLKCQTCESPDPRGFPKVCLVLDRFLQEKFPKEYAMRRDAIVLYEDLRTATNCNQKSNQKGLTDSSSDTPTWWADPNSDVHFGVGCDSCGVLPITGDRYKCQDCEEKIGYDLCGDCYKTRSRILGRFNQQHRSDHKFVLINNPYRAVRLSTRWFADGSATIVISHHRADNRDNGSDLPA